MNESAITVKGLRKTYGSVTAVDAIDLDVAVGEVFALLGPNGAGKTTTVEILEGYRRRTGGEVTVLGHDPATADAAWKSRIGLVLQGSHMSEELTVEEQVRHFSRFYPAPRDTDEVISLVGLEEKRDMRIKTLSGGQQRRLDVALGIIGRAELLFLDEPTTGFDPEARRQFWTLIEQLQREGSTILLTTHYLDEAEALADRVGVITDGRIREIGTPGTLAGRANADAVVGWEEDGQRRELQTAEPTRTVAELATRFSGEVPHLTITRPSLEDVYLKLIAIEREPS